MNNRERIYYYDFLRILSVTAVILLHVSVQCWNEIDVRTLNWNVMNAYRSIASFGVPVFVMISGALFLGRENSVKRLYSKNIRRIAIVFVFWSLVYAVYNYIKYKSFGVFINSFLSGKYHMWFLFMIVGLYMIIPLLQPITKSHKLTRYFLILFLFFGILLPQAVQLLKYKFAGIAGILEGDISNFNLFFVVGYSGYFVLGYYLSTIELNKRSRYIIYALGMIGAIATALLSRFASYYDGKANGTFYGVFSINVFLLAMSIFVLFKNTVDESKLKHNSRAIITTLSKCTFGAYLVHMLLLDLLVDYMNINTLSFAPILSIPTLTICITCVSFLVSYLLSRIPLLNKYIV